MEKLENELKELYIEIADLEKQIDDAKKEAEENIKPLKAELERLREDKRIYASKNDAESVRDCIRREDNIKFKIDAQWNNHSILSDELYRLKLKRSKMEAELQLKKDQYRRNNEILADMDRVIENYSESRDLKAAAINAHINPEYAEQWMEWGKNNFNRTYSYFYNRISEIDDEFKNRQSQNLIQQMDEVIEAYKKTNSLEAASKMANVSYDIVMYWYEWGERGFGEENSYFFKEIQRIK